MIPEAYKTKVAEFIVKRYNCKTELDDETARANEHGMLNDRMVVARLSHLHAKYRRSESDFNHFLSNIMAHPKWSNEVICWMVNIQGFTSGDVEKFREPDTAALARTNPDEFERLMFEAGGVQMQEIRDYCKEETFKLNTKTVTDANMWLLGYQCNDKDSKDLCELVYDRYADEIKMGVLTVAKIPWTFGIYDITTVMEAYSWLRTHKK